MKIDKFMLTEYDIYEKTLTNPLTYDYRGGMYNHLPPCDPWEVELNRQIDCLCNCELFYVPTPVYVTTFHCDMPLRTKYVHDDKFVFVRPSKWVEIDMVYTGNWVEVPSDDIILRIKKWAIIFD